MAAGHPVWNPVYEEEEGWTLHRYDLLTGNTLRFAAIDVRRERTGIHAKLRISVNWVALASTNCNIERDDERTRLANSAYAHLDGRVHELDRTEFPKNLFKHALDLFCDGLWEFQVGAQMQPWLEGDETIQPARPLLGEFILDGCGSIVFAPPKTGKSYTVLAMAVSLMYGVDKL